MSDVVVQQLKVINRATPDQSIHMQPVAMFDSNGDPVDPASPGDAVGVGYEIHATGGALTDEDTLLEMIAKLEKRVDDLENA